MAEHTSPPLTDNFFIEEVKKIVSEAKKRNVIVRVMGALAIRLHSSGHGDLYAKLKRLGEDKPTFSDIDFMAYSKQRKEVTKLFDELGFIPDRYVMAFFGSKRLLYYHSQKYYHIDVFLDKLEFSHEIFFSKPPGKGRLEIDEPTISLADLVLEKVQIHHINEKDIKDLIILFQAHKLGETDETEVINAQYVAEVLADDWGFWYDATENFKKVLSLAEKYHKQKLIDKKTLQNVTARINKLLTIINHEPKTKEWIRRAKNSTRKKWYRDVEELVR